MRKMILLAVLALSVGAFSANALPASLTSDTLQASSNSEELTSVRVTFASGNVATYDFSGKPELLFTDGKLTVKSGATELLSPCELDGVSMIDFVSGPVGINTPEAEALLNFRFSGDAVVISNIPSDSQLAVYTLDGKTVLSAKASGEYTISSSDLAAGVYIVRVNGTATRFMIR